jgi:Ca2+:H+ antiporter
MAALARNDRIILALTFTVSVLAAVLTFAGANAVLVFAISGLALAGLAAIVGRATEELGGLLGPGATGVLQSALGNLPELFFGIFALRAGLITVVQATIVGSILGNNLLVLGLAFLVGGIRHGTQRFSSEQPRTIVTLMLLGVAALAVPTLASNLHTPAAGHLDALSAASAIVLLIVFAVSIPYSMGGGPASVSSPGAAAHTAAWPLWLSATLLTLAGVAAAFVSDWFVTALTPAITTLHISEAFTGLVIVAIAGNAVENVVGVQLAAANKPDYAISVILNSPLQIAIGLAPILVLLSFVIGGAQLTLVMPPLLVAALGLSVAVSTVIVYDGESIWLEGLALIGLYAILAVSFWWG